MSRMYKDVETWNVFKGCNFECEYCKPSFQAINKRIKSCKKCQDYVPHFHPERLSKIPKARTVFVAANGDICFAPFEVWMQILDATRAHARKHPFTEFYFQSKRPDCFAPYLEDLPKRAILLTTLETNYDQGYAKVSLAPPPQMRWSLFKKLKWDRKIITIEPIMQFDRKEFLRMIVEVSPMSVWVGYNSRPRAVQLPEPSLAKTMKLIDNLKDAGIEVREKEMREAFVSTVLSGSGSL